MAITKVIKGFNKYPCVLFLFLHIFFKKSRLFLTLLKKPLNIGVVYDIIVIKV
jgi:hypothetical protein